jgi:C4-dicarboxylate-binding protein DctP
MLKKIVALILFVAMCFSTVGCSQGKTAEVAASETEQEIITMKIAHPMSTETPRHKSLELFKENVEKRTDGKLLVEIYPSGQLGTEKEIIESCKLGTIQGYRVGQYELTAPKLLIFMMPFLFDNNEMINKISETSIVDAINEQAAENGLYLASIGDAGGFRNITNNVRVIKSVDDLEGLKIRTPGILAVTESMKSFGANVVSVPYTETYMALKTNVADGEENPYINIADMKFNEVQKYCTEVEYQVHPETFVLNKNFYDGLSDEFKAIVDEEAKNMMLESNKMMVDAIDGAKAKIAETTEIYVPTAEELATFKARAPQVVQVFIEEGIFTQEEYDTLVSELHQ